MSARTPLFDDLLAMAPDPAAIRRELGLFPDEKGSVADAVEKDGIPKDRPLLLAVMPPDLERARKVIDSMQKGDPASGPDSEPAIASHMRFIIPMKSADPKLIDLAAMTEQFKGGKIDKCPADPLCKTIGGTDVVAVMRHPAVLGAVRIVENAARLDMVAPTFVKADHPSVALALKAAVATAGGGPEAPRCSALDPAAGASACVDADRMGELGTVMGWGKTVQAVSSAGVDAEMKKKLLEEGNKESLRNLELAAPQRKLLDDGTVIIVGEPTGIRATMSWALTDSSRAVGRLFEKERCAAGAEFFDTVLVQMAGVLGDRGPDYANLSEKMMHVREAGFAAYPILAARTWPNFMAPDLLKGIDRKDPRLAKVVNSCARTKDGRLEVSFVVPKAPR